MIRVSLLALGLLLAPAFAGCAGGTPEAELDPVPAPPAEMPIEWFAEQWGPFDHFWTDPLPGDGRGRPMTLVDGVQVHPDGLPTPAGPSARALPSEEDIAKIVVIKHSCDIVPFGRAGERGVIMLFTHDYVGPLPGPGTPWSERCPRAGR